MNGLQNIKLTIWVKKWILSYLLVILTGFLFTEFHQYDNKNSLTLNRLNFINGIIHRPFLEMSITIFRGIKMRTWSWSANSIEPDQTAQNLMCRLAWLYTGGKDLQQGKGFKKSLLLYTFVQHKSDTVLQSFCRLSAKQSCS